MRLGDAVKSVTDALGIPQCDSCKERQKKLNDLSDFLLGAFGGKHESMEPERTSSSHGDDGDRGAGKPA